MDKVPIKYQSYPEPINAFGQNTCGCDSPSNEKNRVVVAELF